MLQIIRTLFCVILVAVSSVDLKFQRGLDSKQVARLVARFTVPFRISAPASEN